MWSSEASRRLKLIYFIQQPCLRGSRTCFYRSSDIKTVLLHQSNLLIKSACLCVFCFAAHLHLMTAVIRTQQSWVMSWIKCVHNSKKKHKEFELRNTGLEETFINVSSSLWNQYKGVTLGKGGLRQNKERQMCRRILPHLQCLQHIPHGNNLFTFTVLMWTLMVTDPHLRHILRKREFET